MVEDEWPCYYGVVIMIVVGVYVNFCSFSDVAEKDHLLAFLYKQSINCKGQEVMAV